MAGKSYVLDIESECVTNFDSFAVYKLFAYFSRFDETFKNEEGSEEVLITAKDFLLQGLADENKEIRYFITHLKKPLLPL